MKMFRTCALLALSASLVPSSFGQLGWLGNPQQFTPKNRLSGIGIDRETITGAVLERRTTLMIESQTFSIMRDPQALAGAQRLTSPKMKHLFQSAAEKSGIPPEMLTAISYLESWGDPKAESPAGPKGIMQFSEATARRSGLQIVYATRYRVTTERQKVKGKKGTAYRNVRKRTPYKVLVKDERLIPERAVPAAANYLAQMTAKFGGRDWAIFAYHCGEGCVADMQNLLQHAQGIPKTDMTVARAFFTASPVRNRDLYEAIRHHMERDYSPTYWFRIMRAQQLLALYEKDPASFQNLVSEYKYEENPAQRAPHRLSVWLKAADFAYKTCDDIRKDEGKRLVKVFDDPKTYGFTLRKSGLGAIGSNDLLNQEYYLQASPAAIGTLAYIAFETKRLHAAMKPRGETFVPLEVTGLVKPLSAPAIASNLHTESLAHCTGQVFDLDFKSLPPGEREALQFVLDDLGWNGYLGFVEESPNSGMLHIGCSPTSREFFTSVFEEAVNGRVS